MKIFCMSLLFLFYSYEGLCADVITPIVSIKDIYPPSTSTRVESVSSSLSRVESLKGENIILECETLYLTDSGEIFWKKSACLDSSCPSQQLNDGLKSRDASLYKVSQGTAKKSIRLEVMSVDVPSGGIYYCEVIYDNRSPSIKVFRQVSIVDPPKIEYQKTSFSQTKQVNDKLVLSCSASGIPAPTIFWERIGGTSSIIRGYGKQVQGNTITIDSVQAEDRGIYMCTAMNRLSSLQWQINLYVKFQPKISFVSPSLSSATTNTLVQKPGCNLEILCVVDAYPRVEESSVRLTKGGKTFTKDDSKVSIYFMKAAGSTSYYSVNLEPFLASDAGTYTCVASNSEGSSSQTVVVSTANVASPGRSGRAICSSCAIFPSSMIVLVSFVFYLLIK